MKLYETLFRLGIDPTELRRDPREGNLEKCIKKIALDRRDTLPIVKDDCLYCNGYGRQAMNKDCYIGEFQHEDQ